MEAHWANIASGDYQSAYDTFVSSYGTGRSDWVADQQRYGARVADVQATTEREDGDSAQVEVSVLTRDAGRGEETCNRFSGTVLMAVPSAAAGRGSQLLPARRDGHLVVGRELRRDFRLSGDS
jgi:hypothetical protein